MTALPGPKMDQATGYGFHGGHKITQLAHEPLAHEANIRSRAQSILMRGGRWRPAPPIEEALAIIAEDERAKHARVTVPLRELAPPAGLPAGNPTAARPASHDKHPGHIHGDRPCAECGDDAELHELRRARDLVAADRCAEITDAGREALANSANPVPASSSDPF